MSGCTDKYSHLYDDEPKLCKEIQAAWKQKKHKDVILLTDKLAANFAFSRYLPDAMLLVSDIHASMHNDKAAIESYRAFIKLYPDNKNVPHALYSICTILFKQLNTVDRDQQITKILMEYLQTIINDYSDSKYVEDAKKMLKICNGQCAAYEIYWATLYQKKRNYAAAINRLTSVIEHYIDTDFAPEALYRLAECFIAIGGHIDAATVTLKLKEIARNSSWYIMAVNLCKEHKIHIPETHNNSKNIAKLNTSTQINKKTRA